MAQEDRSSAGLWVGSLVVALVATAAIVVWSGERAEGAGAPLPLAARLSEVYSAHPQRGAPTQPSVAPAATPPGAIRSWTVPMPDPTHGNLCGLAAQPSNWLICYRRAREHSVRPITEAGLGPPELAPEGAKDLVALAGGGSEPVWLIYTRPWSDGASVNRDAPSDDGYYAVRVGEPAGPEPLMRITSTPLTSVEALEGSWMATSPPRGIVRWEASTYNMPLSRGYPIPGRPRRTLQSRSRGYVTTQGGRWYRTQEPHDYLPHAVAASPTGFIKVVNGGAPFRRTKGIKPEEYNVPVLLRVAWLNERGATIGEATQTLTREQETKFGTSFGALLESSGAVRVVGSRSWTERRGPRVMREDKSVLVAGFDAKRRPLDLLELPPPPGAETKDLVLFECGGAPWLVEHAVAGEDTHRLYATRLSDSEPKRQLLWERNVVYALLGFRGLHAACAANTAAVVAHIDPRRDEPSIVAFAEWRVAADLK